MFRGPFFTGHSVYTICSVSFIAGGVFWKSAPISRWHPDLRLLSAGIHRQSTKTYCSLCRYRRWLDAFWSTSAECIQDGNTVVRISPSTKSSTFRSVGCWLRSRVACQMRARSRYFHWRDGWFSKLVDRTMFSRYYADYTGFEYQNVFRSGWQCWCRPIAAYTALHPATWPQIYSMCHISTHVGNCALLLHQRWSLHALCVLPLETAPSRRLLNLYGTVCHSQSGHRRRCKFSAADWRPNCLPDLTAVPSLT